MTRAPFAVIACAAASVWLRAAEAPAFDARTVAFSLSYHRETSSFADVAAVVLPADSIILDISHAGGEVTAATEHGTLVQQSRRQWRWTAPPAPGTYDIVFAGPGKKDKMRLHAFVAVPAGEVRNGLLNGYRIGEYPSTPLNSNPLYVPPAGFIEVTKANQDTKLSPHFTVKQFLCKEDTTKTFPKYIALNERLPLKLEAVLARVNEMGFAVDTLHVMSAYRTPYYNRAIGDAKYSMHQWGSAADVYVDPRKNDRMEDLTGDGVVDVGDAKFLYDAIEQMLSEPAFRKFQGGMGFYPATAAHPPFVHVDVRGTAARWKG